MPFKDPAAYRAWLEANPRDRREYHRSYYAAHKDDPEYRRKRLEGRRKFKRMNPETMRARWRQQKAKRRTGPRMSLFGQEIAIDSLPPDLRSLALLIKEARKELRRYGLGYGHD